MIVRPTGAAMEFVVAVAPAEAPIFHYGALLRSAHSAQIPSLRSWTHLRYNTRYVISGYQLHLNIIWVRLYLFLLVRLSR